MELSYPRTFVPGNESSIGGTFVPWNFRSLELSFPGTFIPWNLRSLELSSPGTFVPKSEISMELSFPIIDYYCTPYAGLCRYQNLIVDWLAYRHIH